MYRISKSVQNFYIHIPFCIKKCYFCAFPIHAIGQYTSQNNKQFMYDQYCSKLSEEIQYTLKQSQLSNKIQSIYFGGGTPSLLSTQHLQRILNNFKTGIDDNTQITIEVNPQEIHKIEQFSNIGFNRFSIGIQSLNNQILRNFNRLPFQYSKNNLTQILSSIKGRKSINFDFIIDFNNKKQDHQQMLKFIQQAKPQHISLYILQINQGSYLHKYQYKFKQNVAKYEKYEQLCNYLSEIGYQQYQVSNFCMRGYRSKHNLAYWKGNKQFGGFGMGATSLLNKFRVSRPKNLTKYYKYVQILKSLVQQYKTQQLSNYVEINNQSVPSQQIKWIILSRLRQKQGITWNQLRKYIKQIKQISLNSQSIIQNCKQMLKSLAEQKQCIIDLQWIQQGVKVKSPKGFLFVDQIGYRLIDCIKI